MMMRKGLHTVPARRAHFPDLTGAAALDPCAAAEARVCSAIAALGRQAGIDVDRGEGPEDIDAALIQAAYECNFDDPQCLGGPGCFSAALASGTVADLSDQAGVVTRGFLRYLRRRASDHTLREAQACVAIVDDALLWITRAADSH